jgi:hypothetical protein
MGDYTELNSVSVESSTQYGIKNYGITYFIGTTFNNNAANFMGGNPKSYGDNNFIDPDLAKLHFGPIAKQ